MSAGYLTLGARDKTDSAKASGCSDKVTVSAAPDIADTVKKLLHDAGCGRVKVTANAGKTVLDQVNSGRRQPDLWIPDSSLWSGQVDKKLRTLVPSLAKTPVVLASGEGNPATSWPAALASKNFELGDPGTSTPAVTALWAGTGASKSRMFQMALRAPDAKPARTNQDSTDQARRLQRVAKTGGSTVVTEQAWLAEAPDLSASVPSPGTISLDYPLVLTADSKRQKPIKKTTDTIAAALTGDDAARALSKQRFRAPDRPLPANGVGKVTALPSDTKTFSALLDQWGSLMRPVRAIAVADVSGSMNFPAGDTTRAELVVKSAQRLVPLFPGRTTLGFWVFSQADDGSLGADYRQALPARRMDAVVDGYTQRTLLSNQLGQLRSLTQGGTSLYDTTLAAYRAAQKDYDSRSHNSVFLFTDGKNEDPDSISRAELISQLRDLANPKRPVRIFSIGMSADADADALEEIAKVTGGESFIAREPSDIEAVFRQVMMASS